MVLLFDMSVLSDFHQTDESKITIYPLVDLYLISEKSIWKYQDQQIEFLVCFKLDFYCLCT